MAVALCLACAAQQSEAGAKSELMNIAKAREALRSAEAAHPGNTVEVADALDDLVGAQLDNQLADEETLALARREIEVAEAAAGPRSVALVSALANVSETLVVLSRAAEARPYAERGFEIAQKEFPEAEQGINSADELAYVCNALADYACAERADQAAMAAERKPGPDHDWDLAVTLSNYSDLKRRMDDEAASAKAIEEAIAAGMRARPNDPHIAIFENNYAEHLMRIQDFPNAIVHFDQAIEIANRTFGPDSQLARDASGNVASVYSRTGQFQLAWKTYEIALENKRDTTDEQAHRHADFARSLASGGDLSRAMKEGLLAARMGREQFTLQARTLPERQALAYERQRPKGLDTALSILTKHPDLPSADIYQEMVRARALVADEMAHRQKNLNAANDPEIAGLLKDLSHARADLLAAEQARAKAGGSDAILAATQRMEKIERTLAERSAAVRNDDRVTAVGLADLRRNLPAHAVLVSYVFFLRRAVEAVDPARSNTPAYLAFVLHPDSDRIRVFDLGAAKPIDELVARLRGTADAEAHSGGLGSTRNERAYRQAGSTLRKSVWDPLRAELRGAKLALVVPDGSLNLFPFSGLPDGSGYLVEHGPVIHLLSSERDLLPAEGTPKKAGLLAIGSPQFGPAANTLVPAALRDGDSSCDEFSEFDFHPLPGTAEEVSDIGSTWRRWNRGEPAALVTGADATRSRFLEEAPRSRVLHVATHAFLLDRRCGAVNPLLHAGLVFAGANQGSESSILTAQQIASLDLNGVDWAVLSACNTGNGQMLDGEGVLGLQRAFRVAGARSVVMALWPVDDEITRHFMHNLYAERFGRHVSTADAVWNSTRMLLIERRAAGKSTHPWYWAGFVGSGGWE